jgi:predicted DNA-binding ribbon-helix-helix protein
MPEKSAVSLRNTFPASVFPDGLLGEQAKKRKIKTSMIIFHIADAKSNFSQFSISVRVTFYHYLLFLSSAIVLITLAGTPATIV